MSRYCASVVWVNLQTSQHSGHGSHAIESQTYCQQLEHMQNYTYIDWRMLGRRGYDIIEWWIQLRETNSGPGGAKFCVYTSTYLVNFPRKLDIQLCIIQQYNSQQLINWILAEFCTNYQYASTFSYNIFMSSWNHMGFEMSCRSISWSTETSRVTGLLIRVFVYQWPSLSRLNLYFKYRNWPMTKNNDNNKKQDHVLGDV